MCVCVQGGGALQVGAIEQYIACAKEMLNLRILYITCVLCSGRGGGGVLLDHSCLSNPQTLSSTVKRGMITTTIITMCDAQLSTNQLE